MSSISTIGLDIAKRFFQVCGVDDKGRTVVTKKLTRDHVLRWFAGLPPCLVGIEACATAHYWAREIGKLGHRVKLIPPIYVKPYVKRQKNDAVDAAAICEAVTRPNMRFVTAKTEDQQAVQTLHRTRDLLIKQNTQAINALRAHLAEFGLIFKQGDAGVREAMEAVQAANDTALPAAAKQALQALVLHLQALRTNIKSLTRQIAEWHRSNADSQRLATIPGLGPITASAICSAIGDGKQFRKSRDFAAWLGLVPRQHSSGGKNKLGGITRKGNTSLRRLLVLGATAQLRSRRYEKMACGAWMGELLRRKPARVATVALAAKSARVAWAVLTRGGIYRGAANPAHTQDAQFTASPAEKPARAA
jgi:transposase